jgi:molecular chaperone HtpG
MVKRKTSIGKDVIDSLTGSMYEDSRIIYREYIQNAADQIDKAIENGQLASLSEGRIEINIDPTERKIIITDNATGIKQEDVEPILKDIAKSTKDRSKHRGFRGIGRLGGLGYCEVLRFETSFHGESQKSILIWDAAKLRAIINNRDKSEDAADVINMVTSFQSEREEDKVSYFKVILEGVSSDDLLNEKGIADYLSMVGPTPYKKGFIFQNLVLRKAIELGYPLESYQVFLNGRNQIQKAYSTSIYEGDLTNKKKIDSLFELDFFEVKNSRDKLLAWGWYGVSNFKKQMPKVNLARGIRMRKGNIQIGMEDCLVRLFKEPRGTFYFFGEVHAVDSNLIPNARRDYFYENSTLKTLEKQLRVVFNDLHRLYHFSSKVRNEKKRIDDLENFKKEFEEKIEKKGFSDNKQRIKYEEEFAAKKDKALLAETELKKLTDKVNSQGTNAEKRVLSEIVNSPDLDVESIEIIDNDKGQKTKYSSDDMVTLNRKERKLISRVFKVIDQVLVPGLSENLKEKIKEEFND